MDPSDMPSWFSVLIQGGSFAVLVAIIVYGGPKLLALIRELVEEFKREAAAMRATFEKEMAEARRSFETQIAQRDNVIIQKDNEIIRILQQRLDERRP